MTQHNFHPAGIIGSRVSGHRKMTKRELKGHKMESFQDAVLIRSFSQQ
jgi:hypothetical protein